jgi:hypothetical protein
VEDICSTYVVYSCNGDTVLPGRLDPLPCSPLPSLRPWHDDSSSIRFQFGSVFSISIYELVRNRSKSDQFLLLGTWNYSQGVTNARTTQTGVSAQSVTVKVIAVVDLVVSGIFVEYTTVH